MKNKLFTLGLFLFLTCKLTIAQDNYLSIENNAVHTWLRLQNQEANKSSTFFFIGHGNPSIKELNEFIEIQKSSHLESKATYVDAYNMSKISASYPEYNTWGSNNRWSSRKASLGVFYRDKIDFYRLHNPNFFLNINPLIELGGQVQGLENKIDNYENLDATIGLKIRSNYKKKLDVNFKLLFQNRSLMAYEEEYFKKWATLPGFTPGQISNHGNQFQTFQARGALHFSIYKDHIVGSAGYDSHHYGYGMRSLFLSHESAPYLFGKLSTKVWKLKYDNLYAKILPERFDQHAYLGGEKYFTAHHLSVEIFPWWQLGLFETVTFTRKKGYEISYLNPVIFYRSMERTLGSPDKVALGAQSTFFPVRNLSLYGKFLLNEFTSEFFFKNTGYWANKWAAQLGFFYTNVAKIKNLDLQAEINMVRPYTYTHADKGNDAIAIANYTHGNLPLAHPLGAGFREVLLKLNYQPLYRLQFHYQGLFYQQGEDINGENYGNNIFRSYREKPAIFGVNMIYGAVKEVWLHQLHISYEIKPNLFLQAGAYYRQENRELLHNRKKEWGFYTNLRLNLFKKAYSLF